MDELKPKIKIVVTGCLGFIGSHFVENVLFNPSVVVYGIDKCTYAANENLLPLWKERYGSRFFFLKDDIATMKHLPDCDFVVNFAAESHVGNSLVSSNDFVHTNVSGVQNLLELIRTKDKATNQRPVFVHISTDEVYGDIENGSFKENSPLNPSNPYSATKAAADMLILAWSRTYDIDYVIFRPTNNYGIRQNHEKLIPLSVRLLDSGKKICLHNHGAPKRNWLHVEDTNWAIIEYILHREFYKDRIYNISGDLEQSNLETVKTIIDSYFNQERQYELFYDEYLNTDYVRQGQDVRYSIDDSLFRSKSWWFNQKEFNKEIKKIVNYYKNEIRW